MMAFSGDYCEKEQCECELPAVCDDRGYEIECVNIVEPKMNLIQISSCSGRLLMEFCLIGVIIINAVIN